MAYKDIKQYSELVHEASIHGGKKQLEENVKIISSQEYE